jgi:cytochrome b6-f complex subunit 4
MAATEPEKEHDTIPFYPDHIRTELYVTIGLVVLVFVVGILGQMYPVGLEEPADPLNTPSHIKPEWYFLALYQAIKFIPKVAGTLLPIAGMLLVMIWPFIDRRPDTSRRIQWIRLTFVAIFLVLLLIFTIWGAMS